jgi:hypothetical protein
MDVFKKISVKLCLIILSVLTGLLVTECILRIVLIKSGGLTKLTQLPSGRTEFDKITDWKSLSDSTDCPLKPNQFVTDITTNSHGFLSKEIPYKKPSDVKRILYLGDSFLTTTPHKYHFIPQIENYLNERMSPNIIESINLGIACTGTSVYKKAFEVEGGLYNPDAVVVSIFVGNDFSDDMDNAGLLNKRRPTNNNPLKLLNSLKVVAFIKNMHILLTEYSPQQRKVQNKSNPDETAFYSPLTPTFTDEHYLKIEQHRSEIIKVGSLIYKNKPLIESNILEMKRRADMLGATLIVVIIPDEMQVNTTLLNNLKNLAPTSTYDIHQPQRVLGKFFEENGIDYVDLLQYFETENDAVKYYQPNDSHFNSIGNKRVAEILMPILHEVFLNTQRTK